MKVLDNEVKKEENYEKIVVINRNHVTPIALIYTFAYAIGIIVLIGETTSNGLRVEYLLIAIVICVLNLVLLWSLSGAIDRIITLEKHVVKLTEEIDNQNANSQQTVKDEVEDKKAEWELCIFYATEISVVIWALVGLVPEP